MSKNHWTNNLNNILTPCYVINTSELNQNIKIIDKIKTETNCTVILALKGFSTFITFSKISNILDGVTASSIYETRLGLEEFNKNIHFYSPAITKDDAHMLNKLCTYLSFNSISQLDLFKSINSKVNPSIGIRVNPLVSTTSPKIYDPCAKNSRLGVPIHQLSSKILSSIKGIHFHALCEQNTNDLEKVLNKIENELGSSIHHLEWMNWGGGHHITHKEYNIEHLIQLIQYWTTKYNLKVILEPGSAIALNCGYYVATVLDIIENNGKIAILDISATGHMPDILEYPYRPNIINSGLENEKKYSYIIGGNTCLSGDIIGKYSFSQPLKINDKLIFTDMGHYTLVKTSNFNGIKQPSIGMIDSTGRFNLIKKSNYFNFKERLS